MTNETSPQGQDVSKHSNKPVVVTLIAIVALILLTLWASYTTDRYAPGTSRATVSASVVQISPRVAGHVTRIDVLDNAIVQDGTLLFEIDHRPYEIAVARAKSALAEATAGLDASVSQLAAAQAQVASARSGRDEAQTATTRVQTLFDRGIASQAALDSAQTALETAEAALEAAEANVSAIRSQIGGGIEDNPTIRSAELALEQAEYDLLSTEVKAPAFGVVTNVDLGHGQFVGAGTPAITFIDASAIWITADLRENQLQNVSEGDPVSIYFDALPGEKFTGRVESLGWGINTGRNEVGGLPVNTPINQWFEPARKMPVRIVLDGSTADWPLKVKLGGRVNVRIQAEPGLTYRVATFIQGIGSRFSGFY